MGYSDKNYVSSDYSVKMVHVIIIHKIREVVFSSCLPYCLSLRYSKCVKLSRRITGNIAEERKCSKSTVKL